MLKMCNCLLAIMTSTLKTDQGIIIYNYMMDGVLSIRKISIKDLWVVFDSKLSYSDHKIAACKAAY